MLPFLVWTCLQSFGALALRENFDTAFGVNSTHSGPSKPCVNPTHNPKVQCKVCLPGLGGYPDCVSEQTLEIILIRHGESDWNAHTTAAVARNAFSWAMSLESEAKYWDARLTPIGMQQAQNLQNHFARMFGSEDPARVQLAASGLSRAWDTMIIATKELWNAWDKDQVDYKVDEVPALMEFGNVDTNRKPGRDDNEVVYESDSVFGGVEDDDDDDDDNYAPRIAAAFANTFGDPKTQFYKKDKGSVASKARALGAKYPRKRVPKSDQPMFGSGDCNPEQIRPNLERYFFDVARNQKDLLIAGTHSHLIRCALNTVQIPTASKDDPDPRLTVPKYTVNLDAFGKENGHTYEGTIGNVKETKVPNGGYVKLQLKVKYLAELPKANGDTRQWTWTLQGKPIHISRVHPQSERCQSVQIRPQEGEMACLTFKLQELRHVKEPNQKEKKEQSFESALPPADYSHLGESLHLGESVPGVKK